MYRRILVAVDGSSTAARGLDEAAKMAKAMSATLRILHVVEVTHHVTGFEPAQVYFHDALPALMRDGQRILDHAVSRAGSLGVKADTQLVTALATRAWELIIAEAASWRAQLIVIGTHGRRGLERFFLGSDAEEVLRRSSVPVLLVRDPTLADRKTAPSRSVDESVERVPGAPANPVQGISSPSERRP